MRKLNTYVLFIIIYRMLILLLLELYKMNLKIYIFLDSDYYFIFFILSMLRHIFELK